MHWQPIGCAPDPTNLSLQVVVGEPTPEDAVPTPIIARGPRVPRRPIITIYDTDEEEDEEEDVSDHRPALAAPTPVFGTAVTNHALANGM